MEETTLSPGWQMAVHSIPYVLLAVIVLGLLRCLRWYLLEKRRTRALGVRAAGLGLAFAERDQSGLAARLGPKFGVLSRGVAGKQEALNVMGGEHRGRRVQAFDYLYQRRVTPRGKSTALCYLSAALAVEPVNFPRTVIRPETAADRAAALAGFEDIDFESHEFSKRFYVQGADRRFAYALVDPRMMEYLLAHPGWSLELDGAEVLLWDGARWDPDRFAPALDFLTGFLDRVPEHLRRELGTGVAKQPEDGGRPGGNHEA
ncbi:MAG TPA: hypothetical protein PK280_17750 [Planctomycetota bacterium]|nr:hypothetical protein [Planctomycetota bacterium]